MYFRRPKKNLSSLRRRAAIAPQCTHIVYNQNNNKQTTKNENCSIMVCVFTELTKLEEEYQKVYLPVMFINVIQKENFYSLLDNEH